MGKLALVVAKDNAPEIPVNRAITDQGLDRIATAAVYNWFRGGVLVSPEIPAVPEVPEVPVQDAVLDADGNVVTPAVPGIVGTPGSPAVAAVYRLPTNEEVTNRIGDWLVEQLVNMTADAERRMAAEAVPAPVEVSPA